MIARASFFDVRYHLATKTRYFFRASVPGAPSAHETPDPAGYDAVHLYLLSRHGSRWPTKGRMEQINNLEGVFKDATNFVDHPWIRDWVSPLKDMPMAGGELHQIGADEMWSLAYRLRLRYPSLVEQPYLPKKYPIISTSVSRAAASASAFASGYFPGVFPPGPLAGGVTGGAASAAGPYRRQLKDRRELLGNSDAHLYGPYGEPTNGRARPQAVAISMSPKNADPLLRPFDICPAYAILDADTEAWMAPWMARHWAGLAPRLEERLGMTRPLGPCDVQGLWQLCLLQAGLLDVVDQACGVFTETEVRLLEWVDDVLLLETLSYGAALNYNIAQPLLHDLTTTLEKAASCHKSPHHAQHSKLLFAHCETLVPLATLMGLFKPPPVCDNTTIPSSGVPTPGSSAMEGVARRMAEVPRGGSGSPSALLAGGSAGGAAVSMQPVEQASCSSDTATTPTGATAPPVGWQPPVCEDDNRIWRGARIAPYGANLAIVLYRKTGADRSVANHRVRLLYNEQVLQIPGCGGDGIDCELQDFLSVMKPLAGSGSLDQMCRADSSDSGTGSGSTAWGAAPAS